MRKGYRNMKKLVNKSTFVSKQKKLIVRRETIALLTSLQLGGIASGEITGDVCDTLVSRTGLCVPP